MLRYFGWRGLCGYFESFGPFRNSGCLVNTLLKSIPSIGYIGILLSVIFYIYATMGVFLFRYNDPVHFGNLQLSLLSLFRIVTLEDWTDIMYINMYGCDHAIWGYGAQAGCTNPTAFGFGAVLYFVSFVLMGTMIVLNLFIGVIMNSMDEAKRDARDHRPHRLYPGSRDADRNDLHRQGIRRGQTDPVRVCLRAEDQTPQAPGAVRAVEASPMRSKIKSCSRFLQRKKALRVPDWV